MTETKTVIWLNNKKIPPSTTTKRVEEKEDNEIYTTVAQLAVLSAEVELLDKAHPFFSEFTILCKRQARLLTSLQKRQSEVITQPAKISILEDNAKLIWSKSVELLRSVETVCSTMLRHGIKINRDKNMAFADIANTLRDISHDISLGATALEVEDFAAACTLSSAAVNGLTEASIAINDIQCKVDAALNVANHYRTIKHFIILLSLCFLAHYLASLVLSTYLWTDYETLNSAGEVVRRNVEKMVCNGALIVLVWTLETSVNAMLAVWIYLRRNTEKQRLAGAKTDAWAGLMDEIDDLEKAGDKLVGLVG